MLHWAYRSAVASRRSLRRQLGGLLAAAAAELSPPPCLGAALEVLHNVLNGLNKPRPAHKRLLQELLLPLYRAWPELPGRSTPSPDGQPRSCLAPLAPALSRCVCAGFSSAAHHETSAKSNHVITANPPT
jgi:hypothetical protein